MDDFAYLDYLETKYLEKTFIAEYEGKWDLQKYPDVLKINGLPIHFDKNAKKILLALSGGADSSLLLYMLCTLIQRENLKTKIDVYTMVRFWEGKPWLAPMATDVYNYLKKKFPNIIGQQHWGFLPTDLEMVPLKNLNLTHNEYPSMANCDVLVTAEFQNYLVYTHKYEWVYSGTTMNPPTNHKEAPEFRNEEVVAGNISWVIHGYNLMPFGLLRKNYTMAQYINYDLGDLLKLTRSCEGDIREFGEDYKFNRLYPPECGHCFFCEEKQWGKVSY